MTEQSFRPRAGARRAHGAWMFGAAGIAACLFVGSATPSPGQPAVDTQNGRRVILVVLENADFAAVEEDPYFRELKDVGAWFSSSRAIGHPSYPNYLALIAGDTFGVTTNDQKSFPDRERYRTIGWALDANGLTWKSYAQGYPGNCFTGSVATRGKFTRKHVPFLSFRWVTGAPSRCANIVDATPAFDAHLATGELMSLKKTLPNFSIYIPDMDNDGHDTDLRHASAWLRRFLTPLLTSPAFMEDVLIVVTFDESESEGGPEDGHIFTAFFGPMVRFGEHRTPIDHYTVLRTIETVFGLAPLTANDGQAVPVPLAWPVK